MTQPVGAFQGVQLIFCDEQGPCIPRCKGRNGACRCHRHAGAAAASSARSAPAANRRRMRRRLALLQELQWGFSFVQSIESAVMQPKLIRMAWQ